MQLEKILKPGTTSGRKTFWDLVADAVLASEKKEGANVSIDVHQGYGSVINVNPQRQGSSCPILTSVTLTDVVLDGICRIRPSDPEGSWHVDDDGDFNGTATPISSFGPTEGVECGDSSDSPLDVHLYDYPNSVTDCSGDPSFEDVVPAYAVVFRVSGMWSLMVYSPLVNGETAIHFYSAPQADVFASFTNICTGTADRALTLPSEYALIGFTLPVTGVASGGTATVT